MHKKQNTICLCTFVKYIYLFMELFYGKVLANVYILKHFAIVLTFDFFFGLM